MEHKQSCKSKSSNEERVSILTDAVMKIVEEYKITRAQVELYISILQEESIVTGFGPDKMICDIVEDPDILQSVAYLVYHELMDELSKWFDRSVHEPKIERAVMNDYMHDKYHTEDDPNYYIDYKQLRIMSGLNYEQQLINRRILYEVKKIFNLTQSELSEKLAERDHESAPVIFGLVVLLTSSKGDDVRAIYKKLLTMTKHELKIFGDNLSSDSDNDAIRDLVQLLYGL